MARWLILALPALLGIAAALSVVARDDSAANVRVRVWQNVHNASMMSVSAHHEDGRWDELGMLPLSPPGLYQYAEITLAAPAVESPPTYVQIRVRRSAPAGQVYVNARLEGGRWGELGTAVLSLDETNEGGSLRYGDITLAVPSPATGVPVFTTVSRHPSLTPEVCSSFADSVEAPPGAPCLITVSDGAAGALTLEWAGGPADATGWQYRERSVASGEWLPWEDWADLTHGCASARACRLTGLPEGRGFEYQVRAAGGAASAPARAPAVGSLGIWAATLVEGDGKTEWAVAGFTIVIPDGVRLEYGYSFLATCIEHTPCITDGVTVNHFPSHAGLTFSRDGRGVIRHIDARDEGQADAIGAVFDQITASIRTRAGE